MMLLIDTHVHLDARDFSADLPVIIGRALEKDVRILLVPNVDSSSSADVVKVCSDFQGICYPMMGLHPTSVKSGYEDELRHVEQWIDAHGFVAIGEIGIDLYWDRTFYKEQEIAFVRQMQMAREHALPVVIHSRKSLEEIMLMLKKHGLKDIPGVFHCYPGSLEQAKRLTGEGYTLGIGGVVTYKNAHMAEIVKEIPLDSLVLETDAPWLTPAPFRGKRNEPSYISIIAQKVAELKNLTLEEVADATTRTALKLFHRVNAGR